MQNDIIILMPLYNDWECFYLLLDKIQMTLPSDISQHVSFVLVNDCSTESLDHNKIRSSHDITIINLVRNLGHQRAIAIGLSYIASTCKCDKVIVMDADGEDRPEDLLLLLSDSNSNKDIIFAKRTKRNEGLIFSIFYKSYKLLFRMLTGRTINFGNFSLIPYNLLRKLVFVSEIWNHFPGGVIRSRLPFKSLPLERGIRLSGTSKMNYISLLIHGISSISVFIEMVAVRLIAITAPLIILSVLGIIVIITLSFSSHFTIPGWATFLMLIFLMFLFQVFFIGLFLIFTVLSQRMHKQVLPALEFNAFISDVVTINSNIKYNSGI